MIKLYEREKEIHNNVRKEEPGKKRIFKPVKFSSFIVTPKLLVAILIVFFVGLGFFYLYRELSIFISNPRLAIMDPLDNFSIESKTVKVEGVTEKDAKLFINDQPIIVDENGKFSEVLVLQLGLNKITVKAINRFEKESTKIITGEAKFENITEEVNTEEQNQDQLQEKAEVDAEENKVKIEVYGDTKPALIIISADDAEIFRGTISPGETKNFEAKNKISISADKGKYVGVKLNGKDL